MSAANRWNYACGTRCGLSPRRRVHTVSSRVGSARTRCGPTAAAVVEAGAAKRCIQVCQQCCRTRSMHREQRVDIVCRGRSPTSVIACGATAQSGLTGWNLLNFPAGAPPAASIGMRRCVRFAAVRAQGTTQKSARHAVAASRKLCASGCVYVGTVCYASSTRGCFFWVAPPKFTLCKIVSS